MFYCEPKKSVHFEPLASLYKAASEPIRLQILKALQQDSFGVLELSHIFATKQSGMSHHLKVLANANLVTTRKEGNTIFYRRPLLSVQNAFYLDFKQIYQSLDQLKLDDVICQRIDSVKKQRGELSQNFFQRNADKFEQQQELICDHKLYAEALLPFIDNKEKNQKRQVIELGPGAGLFLPSLSQHFERVIAADISAAMLQKAQTLCTNQQLNNVSLVQGSLEALIDQGEKADCIVINMVLHHDPSPADLFLGCKKLLNPGGSLLISELSQHEQDWVKERCGDLWLGFSTQELTYWAEQAALESGQALYFGLRNGFQVQIRQFLQTKNASQQGILL